MLSSDNHKEQNQINYENDATKHSELGLNSTLLLAYRDIPSLLRKHLSGNMENKNFRILDFGCGAGLSTEIISKLIVNEGFHGEIYGIDINEKNIELARTRLPNSHFYKITQGQSLNELGTFDLIICNFVLVENQESNMINILKDIHLLLNESGVSIITNCASSAYKKSNKWYTFNNQFKENEPSEIKNGKSKFKEDQPIKVEVFASYGSDLSFTFFDFFHSGLAYRKAYLLAGLELVESHKPLGKKSDKIEWKSELEHSPYKIHILKKQNKLDLEEKNYITKKI